MFTNADGEAWRVARYFVLQGAIHRINLIDHTEVHFPPDAINAISKTVLPKDNLVLRLLQPHLWLSMCVNNTVLEGTAVVDQSQHVVSVEPLRGQGR